MGKIVVVTANFGGFDTYKELPKQTVDFHRLYVTEHNSDFPMKGLDNRLRAKFYKMIPHRVIKAVDYFIWIDGNVQIKSNTFVEDMVKALDNADIAIARHPVRESIYDEAKFIIESVKAGNKYLKARYDDEAIAQEIGRYGDNIKGLYWCGLFARRNTPQIQARFEKWWDENILMSNFDQLNFVWAMDGLRFNLMDWGNFYNNETYQIISHTKIA
jgi:hypothetical protein